MFVYYTGTCTGFDAFNDCNSILTVFSLETTASYYSSFISTILSVFMVFISGTIKQYQKVSIKTIMYSAFGLLHNLFYPIPSFILVKEFDLDDTSYPVVPVFFADGDNNNLDGISVAQAVCVVDHSNVISRANVVSLPGNEVTLRF